MRRPVCQVAQTGSLPYRRLATCDAADCPLAPHPQLRIGQDSLSAFSGVPQRFATGLSSCHAVVHDEHEHSVRSEGGKAPGFLFFSDNHVRPLKSEAHPLMFFLFQNLHRSDGLWQISGAFDRVTGFLTADCDLCAMFSAALGWSSRVRARSSTFLIFHGLAG
jgi:hypothetical protein